MSYLEQHTLSTNSQRIKQRKIKCGGIKSLTSNKNCPKFILGHCLISYRQQILDECPPEALPHLKDSFRIIDSWISNGDRDKLTIKHLKQLLGVGGT